MDFIKSAFVLGTKMYEMAAKPEIVVMGSSSPNRGWMILVSGLVGALSKTG